MSYENQKPNGNMPIGDEPVLPAINLIYDWRTTWLRAMSVAWSDSEFKKLLLVDAKKAFSLLGYSGQSKVGENGTMSIWDLLDITVVESNYESTKVEIEIPANDNTYSPVTQEVSVQVGEEKFKIKKYEENGWNKSVKNGDLKMYLVLQLPPAPRTDIRDLALTDYEAAGKIYPFTGT